MSLASVLATTSASSPAPNPYALAAAELDPGGTYERTWRCLDPECDGQPHGVWDFKHARGSQVISTDERVFYLVGGRGSGKTWAGAHNFAQLVQDTEPDDGDDHTEWAVLAPTIRDARDVCIEGPSGLLRALRYGHPDSLVETWNRSFGMLTLKNGAVIWVDGVSEGAERIQGRNLYGAWCDEVGLWKHWFRAWEESLGMALRKGPARVIATGTPKRSSLAKHLLDDPTVGRRRLRTMDNIANLAKAAIEYLKKRFDGTTLGQQELEGILVEDVEGALWKRDLIDSERVEQHQDDEGKRIYYVRQNGDEWKPPPWWTRQIIGLDPSDGLEDGDEQGLCRIGLSPDDHQLYVLESEGYRQPVFEWLTVAVKMAVEHEASIVVEKNHGAAYLVEVLEQVMRKLEIRVPYHTVDAKSGQSKITRAEPVAGLYEQHKVHHVGHFPDLEDQMCTFTGKGKEPSPDRLDALVWACREFTTYDFEPSTSPDTAVPWNDETIEGGAVAWS